MSDAMAARLAAARAIAAEAGAMARRFFAGRAALRIERKADAQDLVSEADRAVEDLIRARLAADFPADALVGEEGGAAPGTSGFTWVIDPIDGTAPFLAGLPHWCVAIALQQGGRTVAGVIDVPMAGEQFWARDGGGAWLGETRLAVDPSRRLGDSTVAVGASVRTPPEVAGEILLGLMRAGARFYRNGSGANMLAQVAAGRLGGYVETHMHPWDALAGLLMIREAGGLTAPYPAEGGGLVLAAAPGVWAGLAPLVAEVTGAGRIAPA